MPIYIKGSQRRRYRPIALELFVGAVAGPKTNGMRYDSQGDVAIFNACLKNCYFPPVWKETEVIGIPKPGKPRDLPASYRPISLGLGVQLALFADDSALYLRSQTERNVCPHLQKAIEELARWFQIWRIEPPPMCIGNKSSVLHRDLDLTSINKYMKDASERFFSIAESHPNPLPSAAASYEAPPPYHFIRRPRDCLCRGDLLEIPHKASRAPSTPLCVARPRKVKLNRIPANSIADPVMFFQGEFLAGFSPTQPTRTGTRVCRMDIFYLLVARGKKKCIRRSCILTATCEARAVIKKSDHLKMLSIIVPTHRKKSVLRGDYKKPEVRAYAAEDLLTYGQHLDAFHDTAESSNLEELVDLTTKDEIKVKSETDTKSFSSKNQYNFSTLIGYSPRISKVPIDYQYKFKTDSRRVKRITGRLHAGRSRIRYFLYLAPYIATARYRGP
ncbi:hypothetical protein EVAR_7723_1 [Eumeta japonica]|uniref:RNA-directed DNA polymerase from mobile element jockey n=1 Tax=Eumeta variegata TaxID=151549 RepID=A0A4C1TJR8_EUMVA|nr:hypothetical protein EVAR_7723_1 [Eumeta japonica]